MVDRFKSYISRQREHKQRVHTELNRRARERLASITEDAGNYQKSAFSELTDEVGYSRIDDVTPNRAHRDFMLNADTELVLAYLEHLIRGLWNRTTTAGYRGGYPRTAGPEKIEKIADVIVSEGLLFNIEIDSDNKSIQFKPMESEAMEESDREIQALAKEGKWDEALKGYNDAFQRWKDGDYDELIPKKLYYSIEEVLKVICVDLEGWTDDREQSHKFYLDLLSEKGVYDAHGVTAPELKDLLNSMERMVSKVSDDRKQRHSYHDRTYSTLLIHQVGAYIYFLISRYESFKDS